MPIVIPQDIPAYSVLKGENIFVMNSERAYSQDIRPLEIAILNLMPTKVETETQFMRLLSNSPLQVNVTLIYTKSYKSKNTAAAREPARASGRSPITAYIPFLRSATAIRILSELWERLRTSFFPSGLKAVPARKWASAWSIRVKTLCLSKSAAVRL